jgi:hypothetical protein
MDEQKNQWRMDERIEYGWKIDHIKTLAELIGWAEEEESAKDGWHNEEKDEKDGR